jgi:tripartite-type tricarboxylate transporter receptor subunit TctC
MFTKFHRLLAAAAFCVAATMAQAQNFPSRPIKIIIGLGAGGVSDVMVRAVTDQVSSVLGQQFVIENIAGAGGNIAMDTVAKATPDGYTLLEVGPAAVINPFLYKTMPMDPFKDLVPMTPLAIADFAVFVSGNLPVKNAGDFIAYAKKRQGQLNYGSVGIGTAGHLAAVMFSQTAGLQMTHVPYRNIQQVGVDLAKGDVQLNFNTVAPLKSLLDIGQIKLIGFTGSRRDPAFPEVPTFSEAGLPGFEVGGWWMFFAPKGTPQPIVQLLNDEFVKALKKPEIHDRIAKLGFEPRAMSLAESARFMKSEGEKWGPAVKASGAIVE